MAQKLAEAARKMDLHKDGGYDHQGDENVDKQARRPEPADPHGRDPGPALPSRASRLSWAMLLARIYEILPLLCPRCSHPIDILFFITQPVLIDRILTHLDEPVEPPTVAQAREGPLCLLATNRGRGPPVPITEIPIQDSDW
ncbi:hypothetical protein ACFLU6_09015 [Acidobacteriota bacterium]